MGVTLKNFFARKDTKEPRGNNGHNYDKYFLPDGRNKTLAEMNDEEKAELTAEVWRELAARLSVLKLNHE